MRFLDVRDAFEVPAGVEKDATAGAFMEVPVSLGVLGMTGAHGSDSSFARMDSANALVSLAAGSRVTYNQNKNHASACVLQN